VNLNFICGLQASKDQAGIREGKGFGKVSVRAYIKGLSQDGRLLGSNPRYPEINLSSSFKHYIPKKLVI